MRVCTGGVRVSSVTTGEFEAADGGAGWTADHGDTVWAVATHPLALGVATGGERTSSVNNQTTRYYNGLGTLQWSADHGAVVYGVAVDAAGNVCTAGDRTSSITTRYYNSSGSEQWSADHGSDARCAAMDAAGNVYIGGLWTGSASVRKYNSSGSLQLTIDHGNVVYGIAIDPDGNIYLCGSQSAYDGNTARKYNSAGTVQWSVNTGGSPDRGIAVDASGNVFICGTASGTPYVKKYDSSGAEVTTESWPLSSFFTLRAIAVDPAGDVYIAGNLNAGKSLWKYNNSGSTLLWSISTGNDLRGMALRPDVVTPIPPLAIPVALAAPFPTALTAIPPLAIPVALAAMVPTAASLPPLGDAYRIYAAFLTHQSALIPLNVASLQGRRRRNESTWIALAVAHPSDALVALLDAAINVEWLIVYSGTRDANGLIDQGEMLRAVLTEYAFEPTPSGRGLMLTGRVVPAPFEYQTWNLTGLVSRRMLERAQRGVRCAAVHPRLRPGDTLIDGMASWVVGRVTYGIGSDAVWMDIWEDV